MTENATECLPDDLNALQEPLRVWSTVHFICSVAGIVFTLALFYLLQRKLVYLKKRSFGALVLNGIGQILIIVPGNGGRIANNPYNPFLKCPVYNISILASVPLILISTLSTVLSFKYRASLSVSLGEENTEISEWKWFLASGKFSAVFLLSSFTLTLSISTVITLFFCPDFGLTTDCNFLKVTDLVVLGFSYIPSILVVSYTIYLSRTLQSYPDPFHLLSELKSASILALSLAVLVLIIILTDPGDLEKNEPRAFSWGPILDLAVFSLFLWRCPLQIYKGFKFNTEEAMDIEHSLDKVLNNPTGYNLLKQHLISEFSVENILFITAVDQFKKIQNIQNKHVSAIQIYETFLKFKRINLSFDIYSAIEENIGNIPIDEDIFEEAYTETKSLIEYDSFTRFVKTEQFLVYAGLKEMKRGSTAEELI